MKKQRKVASLRLLAVLAATILILATAALPALAMGSGKSGNRMGGQHKGFLGRTAESVESGAESIVDDLVNIPNGTDTNNGTETDTNDGTNTETDGMTGNDGLIGDETPEDGTNIPDTDIGGAIADNDNDGLSNPADSDDDNDGVPDSADTDADGDGVKDDDETTGVIGIVIAVIVVIAIIVLVIAVIPRSRRK